MADTLDSKSSSKECEFKSHFRHQQVRGQVIFMSQLIDITGEKYGSLVVLERDLSKKANNAYWKCQCDCGKIISVIGKNLRNGVTKSCGCSKHRDWSNTKIGFLTVVEKTSERRNGAVVWKCQCDCGKTILVDGNNLRRQDIKSCGCHKTSLGELKIKQILEENNISFEQEKKFEDCRFEDTNFQARFDFYVENSYLIEFDGIGHYKAIDYFGGQKALLNQQNKDEYKNLWCKKQNIPLIRIPYYQLDNLSIKDLLLKTSEFIV